MKSIVIDLSEIKAERKRLRKMLPNTRSSLLSAVCEHKYYEPTNHSSKIHCLVCGYNGKMVNTIPEHNHNKCKQAVYFVHTDNLSAILREASHKYNGYDFGEATFEEILLSASKLPIEHDFFVRISSICTVLDSYNTIKMLSGANIGLDNIKRAINARKVAF